MARLYHVQHVCQLLQRGQGPPSASLTLLAVQLARDEEQHHWVTTNLPDCTSKELKSALRSS